jgi:beta-lactamase regulating signal transducer with metallopeptidase domain
MNWHTLFEPEMSGRICLTLVHSLWQVAVAALLARVVGRVWLRARVEWNYVIHLGALVVSLIAVPVTFLLLSPVSTTTSLSTELPQSDVEDHAFVTPQIAQEQSVGPTKAEPLPPGEAKEMIQSAPHDKVANALGKEIRWRQIIPWFTALYAVGVGAMLLRLAIGVAAAERMRRRARSLSDGPAAAALRTLAARWNVRRVPLLALAQEIFVPTVVGLVRPMILLPASALTGLTSSELDLILAHELAHVRRYDMWVNLLQRLAEVILFFNPALWYLSRRIAALREYCCDEFVCREGNGRSERARADYASALLHVVELASPTMAARPNLAALAADGHFPSELRRRVARLFGEPLTEPLRLSRGGLAAVLAMTLAITAATGWLRTEAETVNAVGKFPPPATEVDRIVAEARSRTFGIQKLPRISMRATVKGGNVVSMQKSSESSLKMLWQARGKEVDEHDAHTVYTLAVDGSQFQMQMDSNKSNQAANSSNRFLQCRYWDGKEGWLGEISSQGKHVFRYATIDKLMDDVLNAMGFPQLIANGARLPWGGPTVVLDKYAVDPGLTRYERAGAEAIDGVNCDIYVGPARHEKIWIEKSTGLVKAVSEYYVHTDIPNYFTELVREVAGRTFVDAAEYRQWIKTQPADMQAKLSAYWAAVHWRVSEPGNLTIFSDYRAIAPAGEAQVGVRWPMHCEEIAVIPRGNGAANGYRYVRTEVEVTDISKEFAIRESAKAALPEEGDHVVDRRTEPEVDYKWKKSLDQREIEAVRQAKLNEKHKKEAEERRINETPINSVADAIHILTEGPKADPTKVWARAIKYCVDHKSDALPAVIGQLDTENRDHPISKLAFALRAMGDRRAVPALIRALPRTLFPSRSDFGLILDDPDLLRFMQKNDQNGQARSGGEYFNYGRAFREVVSALHRLTGKDFGEMELNWVHLAESPSQREQQQVQFYRVARRWSDWWEANWKSMTDDPAYAKVNLPALAPLESKFAGRTKPPAGPGVKLQDGYASWIVQSAQESKDRCFVDLDTMREGSWPASLPPVEKIGVDSPELLAWARREGFDMVCVTTTPPGETRPLFCLKPLDLHVWKITPQEHRNLKKAMAGQEAYPLSRSVQLMVPQREVKPPYNKYSGDAFLFVTREGSAGVIRMTAQVTDPEGGGGAAYSTDDQYSPTGFYRGAKIHFATMTEADVSSQNSAPASLGDHGKSK